MGEVCRVDRVRILDSVLELRVETLYSEVEVEVFVDLRSNSTKTLVTSRRAPPTLIDEAVKYAEETAARYAEHLRKGFGLHDS